MKPSIMVKLLSEGYAGEGVYKGDTGKILGDKGDGLYEVEFSDTYGYTIAILVLPGKDFAAVK